MMFYLPRLSILPSSRWLGKGALFPSYQGQLMLPQQH
jgi:hypothetical protein